MLRLKAVSAHAVEVFVRRATASGVVWCLDDEGTMAGCGSHEGDTDVCPVFSGAAYARRGAACWGDVHPPVSIPPDEFVERLLPFLAEEGLLVGPNWDGHMAGAEVETSALLAALEEARRESGSIPLRE